MEIIKLTSNLTYYRQQAATLLIEAFPYAYKDCAELEITKCLSTNRIMLGAVENDILMGLGIFPSMESLLGNCILWRFLKSGKVKVLVQSFVQH